MEPKFINFFKYLEDKGEQKIPLKIKLLSPEQFEFIPKELIIKDNLNLYNLPITSLPDGLIVVGYLNLSGTPITSLPDGLEVRNSLYLRNTKITSLPEDLKVGGDLDLNDTPLSSKTEAEIRQMAPNVKGKIIGLKKSL